MDTTSQQRTRREMEVEQASNLAAQKEKAGWQEAAQVVHQKKEEAFAEANRSQAEAEALKLRAKQMDTGGVQKEGEASELRDHAKSLESQQRDINAKAISSGGGPTFGDRVKAGWVGVKEKFSGAKDDVSHSSAETGATTKEKFAGFKESVGTKMEELGAKLTGKGHQTKEQAEIERKEALVRKSELAREAEIKEMNKQACTNMSCSSESCTTHGPTLKEKAAGAAERAAAATGDKARELQGKAYETRRQEEINRTGI